MGRLFKIGIASEICSINCAVFWIDECAVDIYSNITAINYYEGKKNVSRYLAYRETIVTNSR